MLTKKKTALRLLSIHFGIGFVILLLAVSGLYQCPIRYFLHVPCPACGMTRAWIATFHLDLSAAFRYHPLFLPTPIIVLYYIHRDRIPARFRRPYIENAVLIGFAVLFFLVYILRLLGL